MKKSLLAIALLGHFTTISAFGDTCYMQQCPDDTVVDTIEGCARVKHLGCLPGGDRANSCDECYVGYERLSVIGSVPAASCTYEIYLCKEICNGCFSGCISDSDWSSVNPGYEKKVSRTCNCNECDSSTAYRCAAGYYGTTVNGTTGCTQCPSSGGIYGTSAPGSTDITSCYIPYGTTDSDANGTFTYTSNCYYSK